MLLPLDPDGLGRQILLVESETSALLARRAALQERCPQRQKSRVERLKVKVEPLLTQVTVEHSNIF